MAQRNYGVIRPVYFTLTLMTLIAVSVGVVVWRDNVSVNAETTGDWLYIPSGTLLRRLALSHETVLSDVYWIRAIQHYGGTKREETSKKQYALLYPLLDITTTLDPSFNIAYRFGAIFLCEAYPNGPGRPDQAVTLLKKGVQANPTRWQYLQDIGFVYYWWLHDYNAAAMWFQRASMVPGASWWLRPLAASTLARGGGRESSRLLWQQMSQTADNEWLRREADRRIGQLAALDEIDRLVTLVRAYFQKTGMWPDSWQRLIEAGYLPRVPVDPRGFPFVLDLQTGTINVSAQSPLFPLPIEPPAALPPVP